MDNTIFKPYVRGIPLMIVKLLLYSLATLSLSGCYYKVKYITYPAGAQIVEQGTNTVIGKAPVTASYNPNVEHMKNGCLKVTGVTAQWKSGAKISSSGPIQLCKGKQTYSYVLHRPQNAPHLEMDREYAQELIQKKQLLKKVVGVLGTGLALGVSAYAQTLQNKNNNTSGPLPNNNSFVDTQGCCSYHGGISKDYLGRNQCHYTGWILCQDGQPSPTCQCY